MLTVFIKHAKNFISKDPSRPLFNCIMFDGEYAVATNTHICVAVPFKSEKRNINYNSGLYIEGNTPDYKNCIPKNIKYTAKIKKLDLPIFIKSLKIVKSMYKTNICDAIEFTKCGITVHPNIDYDSSYTANFTNIEGQFLPGMLISNKYLLDTLEFFNDLTYLTAKEIVFNFAGDCDPIKISIENGAFALITPIRKVNQ